MIVNSLCVTRPVALAAPAACCQIRSGAPATQALRAPSFSQRSAPRDDSIRAVPVSRTRRWARRCSLQFARAVIIRVDAAKPWRIAQSRERVQPASFAGYLDRNRYADHEVRGADEEHGLAAGQVTPPGAHDCSSALT